MAQSGKTIVLFVNAGNDATPNWIAVAQQQGYSLSRSRDSRSISHKDSSQAITILGNKVTQLTVSGLRVPTDEGQRLLEAVYDSGDPIKVRQYNSGQAKREFYMRVSNFSEEAPVDGEYTYSIQLNAADQDLSL